MRLDLSDLRLFVNVVEAGSVTHGATRTHLSVASVSARITNMEQSVGSPLLVRSRVGVKPTELGRALLHHAHILLRQANHMNDDLQAYGHRLQGYVKICCNTTALGEYLPAPLVSFLADYPTVNVTIEELLSFEIVKAVEEGSTDIGIVSGPVDVKDLEAIPFRSGRWVVIAAHGSALGKRRSTTFAEVLDHELVGLGRGIGVQAMLEDEARTMGRPLRQRVQVRNFYAIGHLVSQGVGIGVVPAPVARRLESSMPLRIIALKDKWARQDMRICVRGRGELSLPARHLLQYLEARIDAMDVSLTLPPKNVLLS